jgi:hypothetical protein
MTFGNPHRTDYTDSEKAFITEQARARPRGHRVATAGSLRVAWDVACCIFAMRCCGCCAAAGGERGGAEGKSEQVRKGAAARR